MADRVTISIASQWQSRIVSRMSKRPRSGQQYRRSHADGMVVAKFRAPIQDGIETLYQELQMQMENLQDLLKADLKDVLHAENQIVKALPRMIRKASHPELQEALEQHLEETKEQVNRVEQVMGLLGMPVRAKTCKAMQGILEEGKEVMGEDAEDDVMDAALIGAAQKVEHYEIATYGTLCTYAELLGLEEAKRLLGQNLEEEKNTDQKLTDLAEAVINLEAADQTEQ
jgi:ferritin-like metal-binding protein YciE